MSGYRNERSPQSPPAAIPFEVTPNDLDAICRHNGIRSLRLFGSALKGDARADSDIDLLVEFNAGAHISLFDLVRIEQELSTLLKRPVDLRTGRELSRHFRNEVLGEARVLYG